MMKYVDVAEGCNFIQYQLTEFQLVFYSQMNLTSAAYIQNKSSPSSINISKTMDTRSTQVACSFKDATTSPIKFWWVFFTINLQDSQHYLHATPIFLLLFSFFLELKTFKSSSQWFEQLQKVYSNQKSLNVC
jgi:hypothetical protein